ncbi:MAG: YHS domain-containing (seleno)protein [Reichenbachiella sp.]|uniref:YHS domain-containing (seleno)protein n=1 Tax=Reichenbachiella sp. TaxID=2184521 RepID=UPI0032651AA2
MKALKISGVIIGILVAAIVIFAKINHVAPLSMVDSESYDTYSGIALKGYDAVSYFVSDKPAKGSEAYQYQWKDAIWQFASEDNKNSFAANPSKYAPQFGGYCSFAVSTGFSAGADPTSYKIKDEKLYLFNGPEVLAEVEKSGEQFWEIASLKWRNK